jgi:uncharacterized protein DUF6883
MMLPHVDQAIIPEKKITEYLLSFTHEDGRHKAKFFTSFGFALDAWELLAEALHQHARTNEVTKTEPSPFGIRYVVEGPLTAPDGRSPGVRVVWFVEAGETAPRLATAYPLKEKP